jgi:hypothetical protein
MENNPLRQYFRRPAVYIKLPSGGQGYAENAIDLPETGDVPVYPMTAIDEISARTPDALFNGTTVVELIKSCIPCIKDPWSMLSIDMDTVFVAIKAASNGDKLEVESTCPNCTDNSTYAVSLVAMLANLKPGDYDAPFEVGELKFKFRPMTYRQVNKASMSQFDIQRTFNNIENIEDEDQKNELAKKAIQEVTNLSIEILSQSIEYIDTPGMRVDDRDFIIDFLKNCDKTSFSTIRDHNNDLKKSSDLQPLTITCGSCDHQYQQVVTLNPTDFFA